MKFAAFILLIAAAVVVNAAALQPRIAPVAAGQLCAATGTVTIQGITQPIPPISATCDVGLSCSATQTVEALPDLGNLLGSVTGLLSLLTSLPIIGSLPIVSGLLPLVTGLLNLGILDGLLDGLLGGVLGSLGTANVAATTCA